MKFSVRYTESPVPAAHYIWTFVLDYRPSEALSPSYEVHIKYVIQFHFLLTIGFSLFSPFEDFTFISLNLLLLLLFFRIFMC